MKKQFKSSKQLLFEMVEKIDPICNKLNEEYKIYGSYQGKDPELIDTAESTVEANELVDQYRMAYGKDYTIWIAPLNNYSLNEEFKIMGQHIDDDEPKQLDTASSKQEADAIKKEFQRGMGRDFKIWVSDEGSINEIDEEENFIPHGSYTVSNTGGYEVMLNDAGDAARVRDAFGSDNPQTSDWFEIEYIPNEDGESEPVIDPNGYNIPLNQVMRLQEKDDKWMQGAVKKPGALHKELGVPEDETIPMSTINDKLADLRAKGRGDKKLSPKELKTLQRLNFAKNAKKSQNEAMNWEKVAADNEIKYRKMTDEIKDKIDWIYNDEDWDSLESLHQLLRVGRNEIPIGVNENQMPSIGQKVEKIKAGVDFMFNEKNYNAIEAIYKIAMKLFNQKSPELNENK